VSPCESRNYESARANAVSSQIVGIRINVARTHFAVQRNAIRRDQPPSMSARYVHYARPLSIRSERRYVIAFVAIPDGESGADALQTRIYREYARAKTGPARSLAAVGRGGENSRIISLIGKRSRMLTRSVLDRTDVISGHCIYARKVLR